MSESGAHGRAARFIAGYPCLDFVNTVAWRASDRPEEKLEGYGDLLDWTVTAGLLSGPQAARLARRAGERPAEAERALRAAHRLREAIARLFTALAADRRPGEADLMTLNGDLASAPARPGLVWGGAHLVWRDAEGPVRFEGVLWPIAWAAAELLTRGEMRRVKTCAGAGCGWLFYDTSRNLSRRWCAMDDCGNRAKARRHYARHKHAG